METSIFIAQLLGLIYLVVGLGLLLSGDYYKKAFEKMVKDPVLVYLGGSMALTTGFLIVRFHHVWEGWPMLITLIGYIALLKGFLLLVFPKGMMDWSAGYVKKNMHLSAFFAVIFGLFLGYFGFLA